MTVSRIIESVYSKPIRLTEEQLAENAEAVMGGAKYGPHYNPFYWDQKGEHEYTRIYGEFSTGECWSVSSKADWLDRNYDQMLGLVNHVIELEELSMKGETKSGKPKVQFSTKGMVDLGLAGEKPEPEHSGGVAATDSSPVAPSPDTLSGRGEATPLVATAATVASSPAPDTPLSEAWAEAMRQFGAGSRGPIIVALRKMLGHPIDASAITEAELYDVIAWKGEEQA